MGALKRSRSLDLLCFILPVMLDHLEPSCIYNRSLQTGDWMMCGLYSWWRSIRITLWFDLKLAPDPDTVRSRPKPFICSIMYRSFYTFHLKHLAKGKRQTLCITCKEPGSFHSSLTATGSKTLDLSSCCFTNCLYSCCGPFGFETKVSVYFVMLNWLFCNIIVLGGNASVQPWVLHVCVHTKRLGLMLRSMPPNLCKNVFYHGKGAGGSGVKTDIGVCQLLQVGHV